MGNESVLPGSVGGCLKWLTAVTRLVRALFARCDLAICLTCRRVTQNACRAGWGRDEPDAF